METLLLAGVIHRIEFHPATGEIDGSPVGCSLEVWDGMSGVHVVVYEDQIGELIEWLEELQRSQSPKGS